MGIKENNKSATDDDPFRALNDKAVSQLIWHY